jgi:pimeloyl-ACP methyl ester carboxylesterase
VLLEEVEKHRAEMAAVSPHGRLAALKANVLLLHGEGDDVIPASESLWLARELPPPRLQALLITPLLTHVNMKPGAQIREEWKMLHFLAVMLAEARETTY